MRNANTQSLFHTIHFIPNSADLYLYQSFYEFAVDSLPIMISKLTDAPNFYRFDMFIIIALTVFLSSFASMYVDGLQKGLYIVLSVLMVALFFAAGMLEWVRW